MEKSGAKSSTYGYSIIFQDIESLMNEGNKSRTVAATMMNAESSRSHAVFTVSMTHSQFDEATQVNLSLKFCLIPQKSNAVAYV